MVLNVTEREIIILASFSDYFRLVIFIENTFCVDETAKHTDVESDKVEDAVLVISSNHHAQISDQDILKTTNDRRC